MSIKLAQSQTRLQLPELVNWHCHSEATQKNTRDNTQPEIKPIIHTQLGKLGRICLFVWVSLKTRRFAAPAGRPGDVVQYREAPGETGRLNMYVNVLVVNFLLHWKCSFTCLSWLRYVLVIAGVARLSYNIIVTLVTMILTQALCL